MLVEVDTEPAGDNCAAGGELVQTGMDLDGSGLLDEGEVLTSSYICAGLDGADGADGEDGADGQNGADGADGIEGAASILTTSAESAGENCEFGGTRADSGVDLDGSGTLEQGEIIHTFYVCNGSPGAAGADGQTGADGGCSASTGRGSTAWGLMVVLLAVRRRKTGAVA